MVILGILPLIKLASIAIHYGLTGIIVGLFVVAAGFVQVHARLVEGESPHMPLALTTWCLCRSNTSPSW